MPETPEGGDKAQLAGGVLPLLRPRQHLAQIGMLGLQALQPVLLVLGMQSWGSPFGEAKKIRGVGMVDGRFVITRAQLFDGELADGLQHAVAGCSADHLLLDQALVDKRGNVLDDIDWRLTGDVDNRFCRFQRKAANKGAEPPEEHALLWQ
jgi:hypothetical protein